MIENPGDLPSYVGGAPGPQPKVEDQPDVRNEHEVKQVILIRRDLGMRRGKEIAQGSHASIAFLTNAVHQKLAAEDTGELSYPMSEYLTEAQRQWIDGMFTKVTLQVHSEEELMSYHLKAIAAGVTSHIIQDSGRTEFGGVATYTTCAIGPDWSESIDKITGDLKLY